MDQLKKDAERISSLEIQGASNVAINAIHFLSQYAQRIDCMDVEKCIQKLQEAKRLLERTRVTEPAMRNGLNYIMNKINNNKDDLDVKEIPALIEALKNEYKMMFQASKKKIAEIGARRIPDMESDDDFIVMTHCHSSAVTAILL